VAARAELPSGTVTFLFTDIEGSTKLLHELGERYAEVLGEHRRVLREAVQRHEASTGTRRRDARSWPEGRSRGRSALHADESTPGDLCR
jgi:class 3 adenylate cyclase